MRYLASADFCLSMRFVKFQVLVDHKQILSEVRRKTHMSEYNHICL